MPHKCTYIFPRRFPDKDETSVSDHEKKKVVNSIKSQDTFGVESDAPKKQKQQQLLTTNNKDDVVFNPPKLSAVSDLFTPRNDKLLLRSKHKQNDAFCGWFIDKKHLKQDTITIPNPNSNRSSNRLDNNNNDDGDGDERELLLPFKDSSFSAVAAAVDRSFDRVVSLPRLSSGSSYAGSLFSGTTTFDGTATFSSDVTKEDTSSCRVSSVTATGIIHEAVEEKEEDENRKEKSYARKSKESHYLQVAMAKRIGSLTSLAAEPVLAVDTGIETWDAESVSYRLWVSGSLSYTDKISDGFYNILGMNPYMWVMCNDDEEGKRLPTLMALKAVEPSESSMEVVLVDRHEDSRLKELHDIAEELHLSSENSMVLVEKLGKLVAICMGGTFPVEQGDMHKRWKLVSKRLKSFHKCVVLPIGSLSSGLCRHRAVLFKRLADYIGLPCRIARGCRYCASDHRSSCLVRIKDDRQLSREYVVDLVGEPGNVHGPDSSINGAYASLIPSPLRISHLKEFQSPYVDDTTFSNL